MEARAELTVAEKELLRGLEKEYEVSGGVSAELFLEEEMNARTDVNCYVFQKEKDVFTGFLSMFFPNEDEAEVSVGLFLKEETDRKRLFKELIEAARVEWKTAGLRSVKLVVDRKKEFSVKLLEEAECSTKPVSSEFLLCSELRRVVQKAEHAMQKTAKAENGAPEEAAESANPMRHTAEAMGSENPIRHTEEVTCEDIGEQDGKARRYRLTEDGKELCSCNVLLFLSERAAYLYGLETAVDARRKGAATHLMAEVAKRLLKEDWKELTLQVSSGNVPALKLYQKLGFGVKEQRIYYRLQSLGAVKVQEPEAAEIKVQTAKEAVAEEAGEQAEETALEVVAEAGDSRAKDREAKERAYQKRMEKKKSAQEEKEKALLTEEKKQAKEDERFMREAIKQAKKAEALGEVPIGCVLVADGKIIARGYNRRNTDKTTLAHAEMAVIKKASSLLGDWRLEGCTLYVTLEPCPMCAGAIVQARIPRVVAGCMNPKAGCAGSVLNILQTPGFNHRAEFTNGILEEECKELLQGFFQELRRQKADASEE